MTDDANQDDFEAQVDEAAIDGGDEVFFDDDGGATIDASALLAEAQMDEMAVRASWHLIPKEVFAFLFANCMMLAGVLGAWSRSAADQTPSPAFYLDGLDTIRGTLIFALVIYGFWTAIFNIWGRQMKVWPYVLNAILCLWVGISGFMRAKGNDELAAAAERALEGKSKTMLDDWMASWGVVPPAYWALTVGGLIVAIILVKGILSGAQSAKEAAAEESEARGARRRRR